MIQFEKYDIFKEAYTIAHDHFINKINGEPYDDEKLTIGSDRDYCGEFGNEFRVNLYSHVPSDSNLGQYIKEVYYNGAAYLSMLYSDLHWKYFRKFGIDKTYEALTQNLTSPVSLLSSYIEKEAYKLGFKELIPFGELSFDDYDLLSKNYKGLFDWKVYDKEKYVPYFQSHEQRTSVSMEVPSLEPNSDDNFFNQGPIETFEDLFVDAREIGACLAVLRNIGKSTIDITGRWIGRKGSKVILIAWIDRLEYYNKIKFVDRKHLVKLLNNYFTGLEMGAEARSFEEKNEDLFNYYKNEFTASLLQ